MTLTEDEQRLRNYLVSVLDQATATRDDVKKTLDDLRREDTDSDYLAAVKGQLSQAEVGVTEAQRQLDSFDWAVRHEPPLEAEQDRVGAAEQALEQALANRDQVAQRLRDFTVEDTPIEDLRPVQREMAAAAANVTQAQEDLASEQTRERHEELNTLLEFGKDVADLARHAALYAHMTVFPQPAIDTLEYVQTDLRVIEAAHDQSGSGAEQHTGWIDEEEHEKSEIEEEFVADEDERNKRRAATDEVRAGSAAVNDTRTSQPVAGETPDQELSISTSQTLYPDWSTARQAYTLDVDAGITNDLSRSQAETAASEQLYERLTGREYSGESTDLQQAVSREVTTQYGRQAGQEYTNASAHLDTGQPHNQELAQDQDREYQRTR